MKNLIDKLLNIVQIFLGYVILIGLLRLIGYLFQITIIGGIKIGDIFWWLISSLTIGSIVIAIFIGIGELYIAFNKKYGEWAGTKTMNFNKQVIILIVLTVFGSLILYLLP